MTNFLETSLRSIRRLLRAQRPRTGTSEGGECVLDGLSAAVAVEAAASDAGVMSPGFPASLAARAWSGMVAVRDGRNVFDRPLTSLDAEDGRGALAAAMGLAMTGDRASVVLAADDALRCIDLFTHAAGLQLPMVVHLPAGSPASHAQTLGGGHESVHPLGDTGCAVLMARHVQDVIDLTLIARHVAETALVPVIIAQDIEQTALSAQRVLFPDDSIVRDMLGSPSFMIDAPDEAQRLEFGPQRRRTPRRYDLESPRLLAPLQGAETWALGAAACRLFFAPQIEAVLCEASESLERFTGRAWRGVHTHATDSADTVLVAQAAAVETAIAVAEHVRAGKRRIGVVGIGAAHPLSDSAIVGALRGKRRAIVLDRIAPSPGQDLPLSRRVRAALARAQQCGHRPDARAEHDEISIRASDVPELIQASYGFGGLSLRAQDLVELLGRVESTPRRSFVLGLDAVRSTSQYPKRQSSMDAVRRSFPEAGQLGLRAVGGPIDVRGTGSTTIALIEGPHVENEPLAGSAAQLLHSLLGGNVRVRSSTAWQRLDDLGADLITHCPNASPEGGDEPPIEIVVCAGGAGRALSGLGDRLAEDASIVVVGRATSEAMAHVTPKRTLRVVATDTDNTELHAGDVLLGALVRTLLDRRGDQRDRLSALHTAHRESLKGLAEPAREARLAALEHGYASLSTVDAGPRAARTTMSVPTDLAAHASSQALMTFWDRVGVLDRAGELGQLTADPSAADASAPALSAVFRDAGRDGAVLAEFDPATFDDRPELWTCCPDGSFAPVVLPVRAFIDTGIELATASGASADALRAVTGQLAKQTNSAISGRSVGFTTLADLLAPIGRGLIDKLPGGDDRRASVRDALNAVIDQIGVIPVAATDRFFFGPERTAPGTGELFSLAVNPDACTSAEFMASLCGGRGVRLVERTAESVDRARRVWALWRALPDTPGATIERVRRDEGLGELGAALLSRHCLLAMSGGSVCEVGSGEQLALRHVLAMVEAHHQPRLQLLLAQSQERSDKLAGAIRELLSRALPDSDLNLLAEGLGALGRSELDLSSISAHVDAATTSNRVDGQRLGRLVDVARGLNDLQWRLREGPQGLGRARAGLAIARGGASLWAGVYPLNPFRSPGVLDACGEGAHLALGLLEGQLRQSIDAARLVRWADLELSDPSRAARESAALTHLTYADLSADERAACPPLILVGDGSAMSGTGTSQLIWLLSSRLPVRIVLLSPMTGPAHARSASPGQTGGGPIDVTLLATLCRNAMVAQTSIAGPAHFARCLRSALSFDGPSLVNIHAPSPSRDGFAPDQLFEVARSAVRSRAAPLMTYDPTATGVFGTRLDLSDNPDLESTLADNNGTGVTPIDWALMLRAFSGRFHPLLTDAPGPTPIDEYLLLDPDRRTGRTPFVLRGGHRLRVDGALVRDADNRVLLWRTLQELAGVVTPFTARVREAAKQDVAAAHATQLAALKGEHEQRLAQLQGEFEASAAARVTERLMALAGYADDEGAGA